jgi:LytTr DNA-binding domain
MRQLPECLRGSLSGRLACLEKTKLFREMSYVNRPHFWPIAVRTAAFAAGIGVLLGTFGPFGTSESMTMAGRYAFWVTCVLAGTCIHLPAYRLGEMLGDARGWSAWVWVPTAGLAAALPMTFMVNGIAASIFSNAAIEGVITLYADVAAISVPILVVVHLVSDWLGLRDPLAPEGATPPPRPAFAKTPLAPEPDTRCPPSELLDAIPARLGREILCLQMEDHYVRVHTPLGDAMVHGRMADFEAELRGHVDGLRVHRSWWVARVAVRGWTKEAKSLTLQLSNGLSVPIARDRQAAVRNAGWLG